MPEPSAVDQLADGFWERFKALSPISATVNGDTRYDDQLPDPSPAGREQWRAFAQEHASTPRRRSRTTDSGSRTGSPCDVMRVIGEIQLTELEQRWDTLRVVDQMGGPQQLLPQICQFQTADTPERLELFMARLHAYPKYMADNIELLREAKESGLTAPRIVAERTIAQLERMLATPIEEAVVPSLVTVARDEDREAIRAVIRDVVQPADAAYPRGAPRRLPRSHPARERALVGARTARPCTGPRCCAGRRSSWIRRHVHQTGLDQLAAIGAEQRVISAGGRLRRRHGRLPGVARRGHHQPGHDPGGPDRACDGTTSSARSSSLPRCSGERPSRCAA